MNSQEAVKKVKELIAGTKGKVFSIEFIKKNGDLRKMTARTDTPNKVTGGGRKWNPEATDRMFIWSMQDNDWRTIDLRTVKKFKCGEKEFSA